MVASSNNISNCFNIFGYIFLCLIFNFYIFILDG